MRRRARRERAETSGANATGRAWDLARPRHPVIHRSVGRSRGVVTTRMRVAMDGGVARGREDGGARARGPVRRARAGARARARAREASDNGKDAAWASTQRGTRMGAGSRARWNETS